MASSHLPSMAAPPTSIPLSLPAAFLFVLCFFQEGYVNGGGEAAEDISGLQSNQTHHLLQTSSLRPPTLCKSSPNGHGRSTTLSVHHRHGPCIDAIHSRLGHARAAPPTAGEILSGDQSRVDAIHSRLERGRTPDGFRGPKATTLPAASGEAIGSGNYIVTVGIGTPKRDLSLVFDTGSDLTWIQCRPCAGVCYPQRQPVFDPARSATYSNVTCDSVRCAELFSGTGVPRSCAGPTCLYGIQYGDLSSSMGFLATERLTLTPADVFDGFLFGCGEDNEGLFGGAAGLLGLAGDNFSFVSQTARKYGRVFSYCLPSSSGTAGFLTFGDGGASGATQYTPLLAGSPAGSLYIVDLVEITVGGRRLGVPASSFMAGGTLIDSGTVITRLPPDAYAALRTEFRRLMSRYPASRPVSILDTCYDLRRHGAVALPKIGLVFRGGAEVAMDPSGILYAGSASQACLAFAGNGDAGGVVIIGNVQQRTIEVVYDVARGRVGFGAGRCS